MTVIAGVTTALLSRISAQLPTVQVGKAPFAEDTKIKESIWIETITSEFEWRSIGRPATHGTRNRSEVLKIELRISVYREASDQGDAASDAIERCEEIFASIESAFTSDFSLGDATTFALPSRWQVTPVARESGWNVDGRVTVEATNYPT